MYICRMTAVCMYVSLHVTLKKVVATYVHILIQYTHVCMIKYVTRPEKTGLIYAKYTCSYYGTYLMSWICCSQSVSFVEFPINFWLYDKTCVIIQNIIKKLLQFQHSKLGQILHNR